MESRVNCNRCGSFEPIDRRDDDPDTVARCGSCGKKHSTDSVFVVDPDRRYDRDEAGTLIDPRIPN